MFKFKKINFGKKAQTLIELKRNKLTSHYIPAVFCISNEAMLDLFSKFNINLENKWDDIKVLQEKKNALESLTIKKLKEIQENIVSLSNIKEFIQLVKQLKFFNANGVEETLEQWIINNNKSTKENNFLTNYPTEKSFFITRSSGDEDQNNKNCTFNPGGNKSFPGLEGNTDIIIKNGLNVIASYFSENSINQRASVIGYENTFYKLPLCSWFIQKMVVEREGQKCCSGVAYVYKKLSFIQSTYGIMGVVDNDVGSDSYVIDEFNNIDICIKPKNFRKKLDLKKGGIKKQQNSEYYHQKNTLSLNDDEIIRLNNILKEIRKVSIKEDELDIEWTYTNNEFKIVQLRSIPKYTINLENKSDYVKNFTNTDVIGKGSTIVSNAFAVHEINNNSELIIDNITLQEALDLYRIMPSSNKAKIKAVIVNDDALTTSHPAGFFREVNVDVFYLKNNDNIQNIVNYLENAEISIDTQTGTVLKGKKENFEIIKGLNCPKITMPLSIRSIPQTLIYNEFIKNEIEKEKIKDFDNNPNKKISVTNIQFNTNILNILEKLKTTVHYKKNNNSELLIHLYNLITEEYYIYKSKIIIPSLLKKLDMLYSYCIIALDVLNKIIVNESKQLNSTLNTKPSEARLYSINRIKQILFQSNCKDVINSFSFKTILKEINWQNKNKFLILQITNKFENVLTLAVELLKVRSYLLNDKQRDGWNNFIIELANIKSTNINDEILIDDTKQELSLKLLKQLKNLIYSLKKHDVLELFINNYFDYNNEVNAKLMLENLIKFSKKLHESLMLSENNKKRIKELTKLNDTLSHPNSFNKIKDYYVLTSQKIFDDMLSVLKQKHANKISKAIVLNLLHKLIETYDLGLKAISQKYPLNIDPVSKAKNFAYLLNNFSQMSNNLILLYIKIFPEEEKKIMFLEESNGYKITKKDEVSAIKYVKQLSKIFSQHKDYLNKRYINNKKDDKQISKSEEQNNEDEKQKKELEYVDFCKKLMIPSEDLAVNSAIVGSGTDFNRSIFFVKKSGLILTLADNHSINHQNSEKITSFFLKKYYLGNNLLPKEIQEFISNEQWDILGFNFKFPYLKFYLNIPLRQHSNTINVTIDISKKPNLVKAEYNAYMWNEFDRLESFIEISRGCCALYQFDVLKWPRYPARESFRNSMVELSFVCTFNLRENNSQNFKNMVKLLCRSTLGGCIFAPTIPIDKYFSYPKGFFDTGLNCAKPFFEMYLKHGKESCALDILEKFIKRVKKAYRDSYQYEINFFEKENLDINGNCTKSFLLFAIPYLTKLLMQPQSKELPANKLNLSFKASSIFECILSSSLLTRKLFFKDYFYIDLVKDILYFLLFNKDLSNNFLAPKHKELLFNTIGKDRRDKKFILKLFAKYEEINQNGKDFLPKLKKLLKFGNYIVSKMKKQTLFFSPTHITNLFIEKTSFHEENVNILAHFLSDNIKTKRFITKNDIFCFVINQYLDSLLMIENQEAALDVILKFYSRNLKLLDKNNKFLNKLIKTCHPNLNLNSYMKLVFFLNDMLLKEKDLKNHYKFIKKYFKRTLGSFVSYDQTIKPKDNFLLLFFDLFEKISNNFAVSTSLKKDEYLSKIIDSFFYECYKVDDILIKLCIKNSMGRQFINFLAQMDWSSLLNKFCNFTMFLSFDNKLKLLDTFINNKKSNLASQSEFIDLLKDLINKTNVTSDFEQNFCLLIESFNRYSHFIKNISFDVEKIILNLINKSFESKNINLINKANNCLKQFTIAFTSEQNLSIDKTEYRKLLSIYDSIFKDILYKNREKLSIKDNNKKEILFIYIDFFSDFIQKSLLYEDVKLEFRFEEKLGELNELKSKTTNSFVLT